MEIICPSSETITNNSVSHPVEFRVRVIEDIGVRKKIQKKNVTTLAGGPAGPAAADISGSAVEWAFLQKCSNTTVY